MAEAAKLPIIDLSSTDLISTANFIRQACVEYGFFYLVNHGVEEELLARVFEESRKFFSLPLAAKMNLLRKEHRGYTPLYAENLDPSSSSKGDSKESFYIGPLEKSCLNQWPSQELLPSWRPTMESYYCKVMSAGKKLISLIALALNLDKDYFEKIGALDEPESFLRLLHYPGELGHFEEQIFGASAHSDYGMITLLVTDGVPGLQAYVYSTSVCREKFKDPQTWENVFHMNGAFIVNIGDMMERWTNCLFRSTLHRVMPTGQERYSLAFFLDPNTECIVQCLGSCCSESRPQRLLCAPFLLTSFKKLVLL
ncbi:2-oxoglutarate-Fe(II) type oxidoreductase hxnY isoform X2 [Hevea brasiliensis]|uniref:2-oxoglutarate-Fe(II) type oxidoreductase hxnY isoform X2 n=1 Tax=Hevea brasiliensis TaxID=3981 RepID=UPI000B772B91|nr:2-oxoglutarate-Fe(II) type oxidoreductase hxnY isoform X2 [Hevea brasiliensis]